MQLNTCPLECSYDDLLCSMSIYTVRHHRRRADAGEGGDLERQQDSHHRELGKVGPLREGRRWSPRRQPPVLAAHPPAADGEGERDGDGDGEVGRREEREQVDGGAEHGQRR